MRKNSLVNQVEFLGLVNNFVTVSTFKIFYAKPTQKGMDTQVEIKKFTVAREVLRQSHNLIGLSTFGE